MSLMERRKDGKHVIRCDECGEEFTGREMFAIVDIITNEGINATDTTDFCSKNCLKEWLE